ncbi:MAG: hypothetical protein ACREF0_21035 [Acetobacteraceae bacterium]
MENADAGKLTAPEPAEGAGQRKPNDNQNRHRSIGCRVDDRGPHFNPMGSRGMGEIGIVGAAATIANAVWHTTCVRVRELPITPGQLLC